MKGQKTITTLSLVGLSAFTLAIPVYAQVGGEGSFGQGFRGRMSLGISEEERAERHEEFLSTLTDEQRALVEGIRDLAPEERRERVQELRDAGIDMPGAFGDKGRRGGSEGRFERAEVVIARLKEAGHDTTALEQVFERLQTQMEEMEQTRGAMRELMEGARGLLDAE